MMRNMIARWRQTKLNWKLWWLRQQIDFLSWRLHVAAIPVRPARRAASRSVRTGGGYAMHEL